MLGADWILVDDCGWCVGLVLLMMELCWALSGYWGLVGVVDDEAVWRLSLLCCASLVIVRCCCNGLSLSL